MAQSQSGLGARPRTPARCKLMIHIRAVGALHERIVEFEDAGHYLLGELHEGARLHSLFGPPKALDFPSMAERRRAIEEEVRRACEKEGRECPGMPPGPWCEFLDEFSNVFVEFHRLGAGLIEISPPLEFIVDTADTPITQRFVTKLIGSVREGMRHVHPSVYGDDGLGLFRQPAIVVPQRFAPALQDVTAMRVLLGAAQQRPPFRSRNGVTALDLKRTGGIGDTTFIAICDEAGVKRGGSGSHSHTFGRPEIRKLIKVAERSNSRKRRDAADSWAQEYGLEDGG